MIPGRDGSAGRLDAKGSFAANKRFVPLASAIDHTDAVSEQETLTAEKRLLYVALTRSQKVLISEGMDR